MSKRGGAGAGGAEVLRCWGLRGRRGQRLGGFRVRAGEMGKWGCTWLGLGVLGRVWHVLAGATDGILSTTRHPRQSTAGLARRTAKIGQDSGQYFGHCAGRLSAHFSAALFAASFPSEPSRSEARELSRLRISLLRLVTGHFGLDHSLSHPSLAEHVGSMVRPL